MKYELTDRQFYILKWIAAASMLADHAALMFLKGTPPYTACRAAGRPAMPLFCCLLTAGFYHTKHRGRHLCRIFLTAFLSEIPFDIMTSGEIFNPQKQNVCFSMGIGYAMLMLLNAKPERLPTKRRIAAGAEIVLLFLFCLTAHVLKCDYGWQGILLTAMFSFSGKREHPELWQAVSAAVFAACMGGSVYGFAMLCLPPIYALRKRPGKDAETEPPSGLIAGKAMRTLCSWFYPLHMTALIIIRLAVPALRQI